MPVRLWAAAAVGPPRLRRRAGRRAHHVVDDPEPEPGPAQVGPVVDPQVGRRGVDHGRGRLRRVPGHLRGPAGPHRGRVAHRDAADRRRQPAAVPAVPRRN